MVTLQVEQLIKDEVDYQRKAVSQYELPSYYKANYKVRELAPYCTMW